MKVYNDYYQCCYNNDRNYIMRHDRYDRWGIDFINTPMNARNILSFKDEMMISCKLMYEDLCNSKGKVNIFFSGGTDSECLLRCFYELGIDINPIIIIHHHLPSSAETLHALNVCEELNLKPSIFNVNLVELVEDSTFFNLGMKYQTLRLGMLEILYVLEQIKEPCILGDELKLVYASPPYAIPNERVKKWHFYIEEDQDGVFNRYQLLSGIPIIADSFRYTPHSWAALLLTPEVKDIVFNDRSKATGSSTKNIMMSREFGVLYRQKTGVFLDVRHLACRDKLIKSLRSELFPFRLLYLDYDALLATLCKLGAKYVI